MKTLSKTSAIIGYKTTLLKITICFFVFLISLSLYSQPSMTAKEGLFFLMKIDKAKVTDYAFNTNASVRWFDLYVKLFDKSNYEFYKNDEFKWPSYSKKIVEEITQGAANADFNKLYSYSTTATFGKYSFEKEGFPLTDIGLPNDIAIDDHISFQYRLRIGAVLNWKEIPRLLKIDPVKGEKLVESNPNRVLNVKVVYNVVNRMMTGMNKAEEKYMGVYAHKYVLMNGSTVIGEIKPDIDYVDKVNLKKSNDESPTVTDIDGNVYHTVVIGNQTWMVENLKTSKLNDGTPISFVVDNLEWKMQKNPAYCWYMNDSTHKNPYGALYNWYAVNSGKLAPEGWHIPTDEEWTILINYLGGVNVAGYKIKEAGTEHWTSPNEGVTNESGFTAVSGGSRGSEKGSYDKDLKSFGYCWTSTKFNEYAYSYRIGYQNQIYRSFDRHAVGLSVRCIKGEPATQSTMIQDKTQRINENTQIAKQGDGTTGFEKDKTTLISENKKAESFKKKYNDGSIYDGEWKNNKRNGYGTFLCKQGKGFIYRGYWKDDKRDSVGVTQFPNSEGINECKYEGTYKDDKEYNGVLYTIDWEGDRKELIITNGVWGKWKKVKKK